MTFTEERCFLANACVKLGFSFAFVGDDMDPSLGCSSVLGVMEDANGGDFGFSEINILVTVIALQDVLCSPSWQVN